MNGIYIIVIISTAYSRYK